MRTQTSETASSSPGSLFRSSVEHGFTLVELLVVFAIAALLAGVVPVAYERLRDSAQYRDTVRAVLSELRQARSRAMFEGAAVRFQVDLVKRVYGPDEGTQREIPASVQLRANVAASELTPGGVAAILFLPDGGATGGSIDILRASGDGVRLRVDWLFGRVEQELIGQ